MTDEASRAPDPAASSPAALAPMHIGEVAARTDLSLRTLRHWDEVGLLTPSGRTDGGFRLYTEQDVDKILLVRRMKPLGFTLEAMGEVMRDIETLRKPTSRAAELRVARQRLADVLREAAERRAKLVRQVARADEFMEILHQHLN